MGIKKLRKENNKIVKRRGVSKTLFAVKKRAVLPFPSLICTICPPKISEPELGHSQQQEIGLA